MLVQYTYEHNVNIRENKGSTQRTRIDSISIRQVVGRVARYRVAVGTWQGVAIRAGRDKDRSDMQYGKRSFERRLFAGLDRVLKWLFSTSTALVEVFYMTSQQVVTSSMP